MVWYGYLYKTNNEYLKSLNLHNTKKHELAELLKEAKKKMYYGAGYSRRIYIKNGCTALSFSSPECKSLEVILISD